MGYIDHYVNNSVIRSIKPIRLMWHQFGMQLLNYSNLLATIFKVPHNTNGVLTYNTIINVVDYKAHSSYVAP